MIVLECFSWTIQNLHSTSASFWLRLFLHKLDNKVTGNINKERKLNKHQLWCRILMSGFILNHLRTLQILYYELTYIMCFGWNIFFNFKRKIWTNNVTYYNFWNFVNKRMWVSTKTMDLVHFLTSRALKRTKSFSALCQTQSL